MTTPAPPADDVREQAEQAIAQVFARAGAGAGQAAAAAAALIGDAERMRASGDYASPPARPATRPAPKGAAPAEGADQPQFDPAELRWTVAVPDGDGTRSVDAAGVLAGWDPAKHPRGHRGRFADVPGTGGTLPWTSHADGTVTFRGSLGINREDMPQLSGKTPDGVYHPSAELTPRFIAHLRAKGIEVTGRRLRAGALKPTQTKGLASAIRGIADNIRNGSLEDTKPVFVSSDNRILDGHHTWAGRLTADSEGGRLGLDPGMPAQQADAPISRLIAEATEFDRQAGIKPRPVGTTSGPPKPEPAAEELPGRGTVPRDTLEKHTDADGNWTADRRRLHEQIITEALAGHQPHAHPVATFFGGGPASGKSSLTGPPDSVRVDPDEIKAKLPEYREMLAAKDPRAAAYAHEESSYLSKRIVAEATGRRYNVILDGTGDSSYAKLARKVNAARSAGYQVHGKYVTADTETAVQRAADRARRTGRVVPAPVIRSIHADVSRVFPAAVRAGLFDHAELYDNNGRAPVRVGYGTGADWTVEQPGMWEKFLAKAGPARPGRLAAAAGDDAESHAAAILAGLLHGDPFPPAGVPATAATQDLHQETAQAIEDLPGGVIPHIPPDWTALPDGDQPARWPAPEGAAPAPGADQPRSDPAEPGNAKLVGGTAAVAKFDPGQLRDDQGRWARTGGGLRDLTGHGSRAPAAPDQAELAGYSLWSSPEGAVKPTPDESEAAGRIWYSSQATDTNMYLRHGASSRHIPRVDADIAAFAGLINRSPAFTRPALMWRGVQSGQEFGRPGTAAGKVFTDRGFVSLTANKRVTDDYGGVAVRVRVPPGTHALRADQGVWDGVPEDENADIPLSYVQEYTLPPGSRFKVTADSAGTDEYGRTRRTLDVTVLPPAPPHGHAQAAAGGLAAGGGLPGGDRFVWAAGDIELGDEDDQREAPADALLPPGVRAVFNPGQVRDEHGRRARTGGHGETAERTWTVAVPDGAGGWRSVPAGQVTSAAPAGTTAEMARAALQPATGAERAAVHEQLRRVYPAGLKGAIGAGSPGRDLAVPAARIRSFMPRPYPERVDGLRAELRAGRDIGPSLAVRHGGLHYLVDGNHHAIARILEGQGEIPVRELDLTAGAARPFRADFNPGQSRDEHGRWTKGGSGVLDYSSLLGRDLDYDQISTGGGQDKALAELARLRGFDAKPDVVSDADLDKRVAGGERELWRGFNGINGGGETQTRRFAGQFLRGPYFAGAGVWGNGTYAAYEDTPKLIAEVERDWAGSPRDRNGQLTEPWARQSYARDMARARNKARDTAAGYASSHGTLARMTLDKNAKVITWHDLETRYEQQLTAISGRRQAAQAAGDTAAAARAGRELLLLADPGRTAVIDGYDAVDPGSGEMLILNRGALHVSSQLRDAGVP